MITIGTLKLDLVADREPFVHDLYGRWDTFNRTSLEGIVDEILSRYDTEDELIRIESLDLDLGELEEDEFYEQFPVDWRRDWTRLSLLICEVRKSIPTESLLFPSGNLGWKYLPIICRTDIGLGWKRRGSPYRNF